LKMLKSLGIRFARRGGSPEFPYENGQGVAYEPGLDHPLLIPSAGDARPDWTLADFKRAVAQAGWGRIAVLQFHGVPDFDHPWVHTPPQLLTQYHEAPAGGKMHRDRREPSLIIHMGMDCYSYPDMLALRVLIAV